MLTCRDVAGVAEDLHRSAPRPADEIRISGEPEGSLLDGPALQPQPGAESDALGGRQSRSRGLSPMRTQAIRLRKQPKLTEVCLPFYKL